MRKIVLIVFASLFIYGCGGSSVDSGNLNDNSESAAINNVNKSVAANSNAEIIAAKESNPAAQNQINYSCDNAFTVEASYLDDYGKVKLRISQNNKMKNELTLSRVASPSGVKFGEKQNSWWVEDLSASLLNYNNVVIGDCVIVLMPKDSESQTDSEKQTVSEKSVSPETIRKYVGKTATQAGLKENDQINGRMRKLMKNDFARMKKDWEFEETIDYNENVAFLSGCKRSSCGENISLVFYDVKNDNINVYRRLDGKIKTYFEKGKIKLPTSFEGQVGLLKLN